VGNDFYVPRGELVVLGGIEFRLPDGWKRIRPRDFALREWLARACAIVQNRALQAGERKRREEVGVLAREELLRIEFRVMVHALLRYPYYPAPEERWKEAVEIRMGAKYVMVIHPDQVQVDAALFRELCEMGGVSSDMFETDLPQRFLLDYCRARNIPCIDLLPAFRERSRRTRLYSFGDTHYNEEGNRLAAEEIFRFLTDRGLVPIRKPG
jgi:hypothetical protein